MARSTVSEAMGELDDPDAQALDRSGRAGGSRKSATVADPGLAAALAALVDPATRGGSDVAVALDGEVHADAGRDAHSSRASGIRSDRGQIVAC